VNESKTFRNLRLTIDKTVTKGGFRSSLECLLDGMEEFGGVLGLWEQAAEWGRDHKKFRRWWIRAAMADGHAEWLEKEKYHHYS